MNNRQIIQFPKNVNFTPRKRLRRAKIYNIEDYSELEISNNFIFKVCSYFHLKGLERYYYSQHLQSPIGDGVSLIQYYIYNHSSSGENIYLNQLEVCFRTYQKTYNENHLISSLMWLKQYYGNLFSNPQIRDYIVISTIIDNLIESIQKVNLAKGNSLES